MTTCIHRWLIVGALLGLGVGGCTGGGGTDEDSGTDVQMPTDMGMGPGDTGMQPDSSTPIDGEVPDGTVVGPDGEVPDGTVITPDGEVPDGTVITPDGEVPDGSVITPDGGVPDVQVNPDGGGPGTCGATGDYVEQDDSANSTGAGVELTELTLTFGESFTVGGCIRPEFAELSDGQLVADVDLYHFNVGPSSLGTQVVSGSITSTGGALAEGLTVLFYARVRGEVTVVGGGQLGVAGNLITPMNLSAGADVLMLVVHPNGELADTDVFSYQIRIESLNCAAAGTGEPALATESRDNNDIDNMHAANDMFSYDWLAPEGEPRILETASTSDMPETTGLIATANTSHLFVGNSAAVENYIDTYLDRDTFQFSTGGNVRRVVFHITWPADANGDMDFFVVPAGSANDDSILGSGTSGAPTVEYGGVPVAPNSSYWLWVGNYRTSVPPETGVPYRITACFY
jgi:hypothetical protein